MLLKQRLHNLGLASLVLSLIFLIVVLTIIDPNATIWVLAAFTIICPVIHYAQPQRADQFLLMWDNMSSLVHWGIISVFLLSMFYYLLYFFRSFKIDFSIIPKESNE